ncbi:MAG: 3-isopropylmalate dehydratase small subunit [Acidobacteriota bacterium]
MLMKFRATAHAYGNYIDTEQILPARYCLSRKPEDLVPHLMEGADPEFAKRMKKGDIIVGGHGFGCGSPREIAALVIKWAGIRAVLADSFDRFFYRNAVNIGLPVLEVLAVQYGIKTGELVEVDPDQGLVRNVSKMRGFHCTPIHDFVKTLILTGGLEDYARRRITGGQRI